MATAHILPDLLAPGLRLVFCGTGASARSALERAYYAHPGNLFWPTLHRVGLTPEQFAPVEFRRLLDLGIGLTDVVKTASGSDAQLPKEAFDGAAVQKKVLKYAPAFVGFTSKKAASSCLGLKKVNYGPMSETLGASRLFVLPSPSGLARGFWDEDQWRELADLVSA